MKKSKEGRKDGEGRTGSRDGEGRKGGRTVREENTFGFSLFHQVELKKGKKGRRRKEGSKGREVKVGMEGRE